MVLVSQTLEAIMQLPNIKNIIAVASGKGGVGKSTVSANLAVALSRSGASVGLMDADVYGPSIPTIMGVNEKPQGLPNNRIVPVEKFGVKIISMGFFVPANEAVIWRGPMLHKMVQDFLGIVEWGTLDTLIIDLPPGTGDIQLSLCQTIPLTGAVIVSTPQDVAWNVAQKAIVMFGKLNTPVIGIIENMSHYVCRHCGEKEEIFGRGGAKRAAKILGISFLGEIPLLTQVRTASDKGEPVVLYDPESPASLGFKKIAGSLTEQIDILKAQGQTKIIPKKIGSPNEAVIRIEWNDGTENVYDPRNLRFMCPCASCVNENSGERMLDLKKISPDIRAIAIHPVGRYALQIVWSDGHSTGLYGFDALRRL